MRLTYEGRFGEVITTDGSAAATEFLASYLRAADDAKDKEENRKEAMMLLAMLVLSAGGHVEIGRRTLFGGGRDLQLTIEKNERDDSIVFRTRRAGS